MSQTKVSNLFLCPLEVTDNSKNSSYASCDRRRKNILLHGESRWLTVAKREPLLLESISAPDKALLLPASFVSSLQTCHGLVNLRTEGRGKGNRSAPSVGPAWPQSGRKEQKQSLGLVLTAQTEATWPCTWCFPPSQRGSYSITSSLWMDLLEL